MEYEKIIIKWKEFEIPNVLPRIYNLKLDHDFVTTITGPRRAGKTYLCYQTIIFLLNKGIYFFNLILLS